MIDPRTLPSNGDVALNHLRGTVEAKQFVPGRPARVIAGESSLTRRPNGGLDKSLIFGHEVIVIGEEAGLAFIQCSDDGYVGYVPSSEIGPPVTATHRVSSLGSHLYDAPDLKAPTRLRLPFGSRLKVTGEVATSNGPYIETPDGFLPKGHLRPLEDPIPVMETIALFLGTPYLWGGNSDTGVDCSGLIQQALHAANQPCPRDSDQQELELGELLDHDERLQTGDLIFWKGHVGILQDENTLIHANAFHMRVAAEDLSGATRRIGRNEFGQVTARKRLCNV